MVDVALKHKGVKLTQVEKLLNLAAEQLDSLDEQKKEIVDEFSSKM